MKVEVWSDLVCPWCYIGERRFQRALDAFPGRERVEMRFAPFQLDPAAPAAALPLTTYLTGRYGAHAAAMQERAGAAAREEGIVMRWDAALAVNTRSAHRLVGLAEREHGAAVQRALVDRLFGLHFERGGDLGDVDTLVAEAAAAGMDADRARAYLEAGEGAAELDHDLARAYALGVGSVPTFLIDDRWVIQGAQPTAVFARALGELAGASGPVEKRDGSW